MKYTESTRWKYRTIQEDVSREEVAGASPSISRNPMRSIEDMDEQSDNSFDGVINNVKVEPGQQALWKSYQMIKNPYWKN